MRFRLRHHSSRIGGSFKNIFLPGQQGQAEHHIYQSKNKILMPVQKIIKFNVFCHRIYILRITLNTLLFPSGQNYLSLTLKSKWLLILYIKQGALLCILIPAC